MRTIPMRAGLCLFALLSAIFLAIPVHADPSVVADWEVALPADPVVDLAAFNGELVGALKVGGVLAYNPDTRTFRLMTTADGLGSNRVQCVVPSPAGELWMGTMDAGISRLLPDGRVRLITALPDQLSIRTIAFVGDNAYYGGPDGGGRIVSGLPERSFTTTEGLVSDNVRAVAARGSKAWFATDAGVSEFDTQLNGMTTRNDGLGNLSVHTVLVAGGTVYAGTPVGLFQLDETNPDSTVWVTTTPPLNAWIVDLATDGDRLAVLGSDRRVWSRKLDATDWDFAQVGIPDNVTFSLAVDSRGRIFTGGRRLGVRGLGVEQFPLFQDLQGNASPDFARLFGPQFFGLVADRSGGAWVGAFPPEAGVSHWRADGGIGRYVALDSGNATDGYNGDGWISNLKIDLLEASDGSVWVSSFQKGVTRMTPAPDDDPAGATYVHFTSDNSPLGMNRVISISEDPYGQIWFAASGEVVSGDFNAGIDILKNPDDPFNPASWISIRPSNSQLAGDGLFEITFEGDQVVWLTVRDVGIQRWVYGIGNGVDPSAINDPSSWKTIASLPETRAPNLTSARQVAVGPDGRYWVATKGQGLFSFELGVPIPSSSVRNYRVDSFGASLISDDVLSVEVDPLGNIWAATGVGINRIREVDNTMVSDAWVSLDHFLAFDLGKTYSPGVLRPLPGGAPVSLDLGAAGRDMFIVTSLGVARVDMAEAANPPGSGDQAAAFGLYPNPVHAGEELVVSGFDGEAAVKIYDLQGRLLRSTKAFAGDIVWRLETITGAPIANGVYLVRLNIGGEFSSRVVAVER